jgi:putative membrane protein
MSIVANVLIALVALLHLYFLVLEMFLWDKPAGLRAFGHTPVAAAARTRYWPPTRGCWQRFLAEAGSWG